VTLETTKETSPVAASDTTLVFLCSDVVKGGSGESIVDALNRTASDARVHVVRKLCAAPFKLSAVVKNAGAHRVVIACRDGAEVHGELVALLRRTGIHPSGVVVLDMRLGEKMNPGDVGAQSVMRVQAALARVSCGDLTASVHERGLASSTRFSRRNLFRPGDIARSPVASWLENRCGDGVTCRTCIDTCPIGALNLVGNQVSVDEVLCTGCGVCVSACRSGAMSLGGVPLNAFEAEANVLVKGSPGLSSRPGVAIVCADADCEIPLGGAWLPLKVPALEMVSIGWLLQILAAGTSVRLVGCDDVRCVTRGREITNLCIALVQEAAPAWNCQLVMSVDRDPEQSVPDLMCIASPVKNSDLTIQFHEPEATMAALSTMGSANGSGANATPAYSAFVETVVSNESEPWSIESVLLPLGEVTVNESRCSACGRCALACSTGALALGDTKTASFVLTLDPGACSACGACVSSCPEGAINLRHAIDSSRLTSRRRTVVEIANNTKCASCGGALASGLAPPIIAKRLAVSHPLLAERLRTEVKCADCLLTL
jgi:ferredoxin